MSYEKNPTALIRDIDPTETSFEAVLETACERLREKYIEYSIRRIREMDDELTRLEKELDKFIGNRLSGHSVGP
jgi:hypothetical protein